jgi:hypothetical protein
MNHQLFSMIYYWLLRFCTQFITFESFRNRKQDCESTVPKVGKKIAPLRKSSATRGTNVRLLARMNSLMVLELPHGDRPEATLAAKELLRPQVPVHVLPQVGRTDEAGSAEFTDVLPLLGVALQVRIQPAPVHELFAAL